MNWRQKVFIVTTVSASILVLRLHANDRLADNSSVKSNAVKLKENIQIASSPSLSFLPLREFSQLSVYGKNYYIIGLKTALVDFERNLGIEFSEMESSSHASLFFGIESAFADGERTEKASNEGKGQVHQCVIGGLLRNAVQGRGRNGQTKWLCPTGGRTCKGPGTFRCGAAFSNVCVKVKPISLLSRRCQDESANQRPTDQLYQIISTDSAAIYKSICEPRINDGETFPFDGACYSLEQRLALLKQMFTPDQASRDANPASGEGSGEEGSADGISDGAR